MAALGSKAVGACACACACEWLAAKVFGARSSHQASALTPGLTCAAHSSHLGLPAQPILSARTRPSSQPFLEASTEALEVLLVDDTIPSPLVFSMRGLFDVGEMPRDRPFTVRSLAEDNGGCLRPHCAAAGRAQLQAVRMSSAV